jgi:hypothetical protein
MSMMDAMSMGAQPPQEMQAPQTEQMSQDMLRMGGDNPEEMQKLYNKVMSLITSEIWEGQGADMVSDQLIQEDSEPAEIIGKFTGFYLLMATAAAKSKGGAFPPVVLVGAAGETASQLTDLALMLKLISPEEADDTADAGALIGLEVLIAQGGNQMSPTDKQEYADIVKAVINASPNAQEIAEEGAEDAIEDVEEMGAPDDSEEEMMAQTDVDMAEEPRGMAAAMGGM